MDVYCELLKGPGVLNPQYRHLADELRLLRESSSSLMDRLLIQAIRLGTGQPSPQLWEAALSGSGSGVHDVAAEASKNVAVFAAAYSDEPAARKPVASVAGELLSSHQMLCALAGPKVQVDLLTTEAPDGALRIASVDFTRVLINLVRNAAEAMGAGGRIQIAAAPAPAGSAMGPAILVTVEDNGPGIPLSLLEQIFEHNTVNSGTGEHSRRRMSFRPRGLGLRIVRELVESGGGVIRAGRLPERGSRFEIVLPMVTDIGA
jgi:signal transduction histidine kinase